MAQGAGLTVTGKLSRANWEDLKYQRTVRTGDAGRLGTEVTVISAGSRRWCFPGTTTTARIVPAGDAVKLK